MLTTKTITDPRTGARALVVNNVSYGSYRAAMAAEDVDNWFWDEVFVSAQDGEGNALDLNTLDIESVVGLQELAMYGLMGKKVKRGRG